MIFFFNFATAFGATNGKIKYPYLIECPFDGATPQSVSLVEKPCDHAKNNLKILDIQPPDGIKKRFGVCGRRVTFNNRDLAPKFVEWVHMVNLLGAEKIHFYIEYVHPDVYEIMNNFEEQGLVEVSFNLNPSDIKSTNKKGGHSWELQVNILTDCFYLEVSKCWVF